MRKGVIFLLFLLGSAAGAAAQAPAAPPAAAPAAPPAAAIGTVPMASRGAIGQLNDQQTVGLRLFNQSCQVCHTQALLNSVMYGPALSQESLGGDPKVLHDKIANGGPLMPGFQYKWSPTEIDAIVAYVKTMPKQVTIQQRPSGANDANAARGAD